MEKYNTLRDFAGIIIFIAWLNLIAGAVLTIFSISNDMGTTIIISLIVGGLMGFILLISFGKLIQLALDIRGKQIENKERNQPLETKEEKSQEQLEEKKSKKTIGVKKENFQEQNEISVISITDLRRLIIKQKQSFIGNKQKSEIISLLNKLVNSKESAELLIEKYENMFGVNLIDELKNLSKNYTIIKEYLLHFIEFKIVKEGYPHEFIEY